MWGAQIFIFVVSSSQIDALTIMTCPSLSPVISFILSSIVSNMRITIPVFFGYPFIRNIFLHPLTFSPFVSLGQKWVSCREHIYGSSFCMHSASLGLLVGVFNLFTFKIIIDIYIYIYVLIDIVLIVWGSICRSFSLLLYFLTI